MRKYIMFLIPALLMGCEPDAPTPDPQPPADTTTTPPADTVVTPPVDTVTPPKLPPKEIPLPRLPKDLP